MALRITINRDEPILIDKNIIIKVSKKIKTSALSVSITAPKDVEILRYSESTKETFDKAYEKCKRV